MTSNREEMDPDLERLIETYRYACESRSFGHIMDAKTAIHRWHVAAVERAVREALVRYQTDLLTEAKKVGLL